MNSAVLLHTSPWPQKLAASKFLIASTLLHGLALFFLWGVIDYSMQPDRKSPPVEPNWIVSLSPDSVPIVEELLPEARRAELGATPPRGIPSPVEIDGAPVVPKKPAGDPKVVFCYFPGTQRLTKPELPESMSSRTRAGRAEAMAAKKMTQRAEDAVVKGLEWLRRNQNRDGSWGDTNKGAMTGLALLCFLGHGEADNSPQYGLTVAKAVEWILSEGTKSMGRLHMGRDFKEGDVKDHAICTYALGEYYAMRKDERVIELFRQAVHYIVQGQGPRGGWTHGFGKSEDDLAISVRMIEALGAAHLTKLPIPGVEAALEKAVACLDNVWKCENGAYGLRDNRSPDLRMTGAGIAAKLSWKGNHGDVSRGMDFLMAETQKQQPISYQRMSGDLTAWYFHTQAAFMYGGSPWDKWSRWFQDEIAGAQSADGSWPIAGNQPAGTTVGETITAKVSRTTLCVLMLETFYRYVPANQKL